MLAVARAAEIDAPVLIGHLRAACPTITIGQTVGSGHFNQLEVPAQVNLTIEKFLAINSL